MPSGGKSHVKLEKLCVCVFAASYLITLVKNFLLCLGKSLSHYNCDFLRNNHWAWLYTRVACNEVAQGRCEVWTHFYFFKNFKI